MKQRISRQFHIIKRGGAVALAALLMVSALLCGCEKKDPKPHHTKPTETEAVVKNTKALAVLTHVDTNLMKLSLQWLDNGETVVFPYNGATWFYSKSKVSISAKQLEVGTVVQVTYNAKSNVISEVMVASNDELMENNRVGNFFVDESKQAIRIGSSLLKYDDSTCIFSDGLPIKIQELNNTMDTLHVWAYGSKVVSIVVETGHGYLSLSGESLFVGGLITVGNILVRNIEDDMLLTISEGTYKVTVEHEEYRAEKDVTIERGKQEQLDFSDVLANVTETGNVRFNINPDDAELYIDGEKMNYEAIVTLKAGSHNITVLSDKYETFSKTFEITPEYQEINIDLIGAQTPSEEETEKESGSSSGAVETTDSEASDEKVTDPPTSMEQNTTAEGGVVSEKNKVTIKGPVGASVYFDSTLKGSAPVTFPLVTGAHIITILEGTRIRSYSVNLAEGGDDVEYDFSEK